jgi:TatD DNase family protein
MIGELDRTMEYFDAHIHLTDIEYSNYLENILFSLKSMDMKACSVTVNIETTKRSFDIFSNSGEIVSQFVGIHPQYVLTDDLDIFKELVESNLDRVDGIGEIGLDPTYCVGNEKDYEIQKKKFHDLLEIAEKYEKPISIHSRKSLDDILHVLPSYSIKNRLLHWFAGSRKQLKKAMEMEFYVSYGPVLLYSPDKKVLLSNTDQEKILVETDGPVRYSNCFNYIPSSSISCLVSVINYVGEILDSKFEEIKKILKNNSENFLGKKI